MIVVRRESVGRVSSRWLGALALAALTSTCIFFGCSDDETSPAAPVCPLSVDNQRVVALEGGSGAHWVLFSDGTVRCWGEDERGVCGGQPGDIVLCVRTVDRASYIGTLYYSGGTGVGASALGDVLVWG